VQRVSSAKVEVEGKVIGRCGQGLLLLVGIHRDDTEADAGKLAEKLSNLRIISDSEGKMNLSILDSPATPGSAQVLAISNFTVYGDTKKNRRPSFVESAPYERGRELFDLFVARLRSIGIQTETGEFGADMQVSLVNDGPVTVIVDVP
jgi:D-aminoacyl-tRNA deacylase